MSRFHELLRYLSSIFPRRCLQILLHLWRRLAQALGLSSYSNQCRYPPVRPELPLGPRVISTSHVPASFASGEPISLADVSQGSSSTRERDLELDTSDRARRQSTSPTDWTLSRSGTTFVSSPLPLSPGGSLPFPFQNAEDSIDLSHKPITPGESSRYNSREP
jgi:hypothetical protein